MRQAPPFQRAKPNATENQQASCAKTAPTVPRDKGRFRAVIDKVRPCVDGGSFPIKRVVGEVVRVEADIFTDGHSAISAVMRHRVCGGEWIDVPMQSLPNDVWVAQFIPKEMSPHEYKVFAWVDEYQSWRRDLTKRMQASQVAEVDLLDGAALIEAAAKRCDKADQRVLRHAAEVLQSTGPELERAAAGIEPTVAKLMFLHAERRWVSHWPAGEGALQVTVDPPRARFGSWYELFPRSASPDPDTHGTFRDVEARLPYIKDMGFDVLYLPPIHPIGKAFRKGRNNALTTEPGDVGSPWAIGASGNGEGGHKAVDPALGTLKDFDHLVSAAAKHGIEIALDIAYQCSPDHPYVKEHPDWFRQRADGTIQYAENPPKKYQDIYPFDFECDDWEALWQELLSVVLFWIDHGVTIFRVDNPHTKAFPFWEWMIAEVKRQEPKAIFLAEAFTRPKVMYRLAKLGFTQSYTYFAWRNEPWEIQQYFEELTQTPVAEFFRPNAWPNTPDILTEFLQHGGRPAFMLRLVLAATLCASYGIYGPAFELMEHKPREPGSEEYLDSEKYQRRQWALDHPDSLRDFIARVNRIRRENTALQQDRTLKFHPVDNPVMLCYSKQSEQGVVLCVVSTDPYHTQAGTIDLDLTQLNVEEDERFQVHDQLTGARYQWRGNKNFISLDPTVCPAHVFRVRKQLRSEHDFEYFL